MEIYKIAMYFATVGVIFGALNGIMDVGDNWFDQDVPNMENIANITISASEAEDLQLDGDSGIIDSTIGITKYANFLFRILQGVFYITSFISPIFVYDYNGTNLFEPILLSFQGLIYLIYIVGVIQFISNRHIEGMA